MNTTSFQKDITLIKSFMKSWENIPSESFQFDRLPGLTNVIYKVTVINSSVTPSSAIYRKFGNSGEVIDREKENLVFTELAKKGVGPSYYGGNMTFRLEEFCDSRVLKPSEVGNKVIRRGVAKALAGLHQAEVEELDKTPMSLKVLEEGSMMKHVMEKVRKDSFTPEEQGWLQEILSLVSNDEINFLKDVLAKEKNSLVFSHNDLHALNILLLDKTEQVKLVDYEYSCYNYRGYDIANFLNESAIDYTVSDYPYYTLNLDKALSKEALEDFVKYYLFFSKFVGASFDETRLLNDEDYLQSIIEENGNLEEFNQEVNDVLEEVKICTMLSHYYWVLWSVVMSKNPEIQFDYLHYAYSRYNVYQKLKNEYNLTQSSTAEMSN